MHQVTYVPRKTNHLLHLILTLGTCGAWAFVWPLVALFNHLAKDKIRTEQAWALGPGHVVYPPDYRPGVVGPQMPVDTSTWPTGQTGYTPHAYGVLRPDGVSMWQPTTRPPLPQDPHQHRAPCHGAAGELQCGYSATS